MLFFRPEIGLLDPLELELEITESHSKVLVPIEEQQNFLTTEPSLQSPLLIMLFCFDHLFYFILGYLFSFI